MAGASTPPEALLNAALHLLAARSRGVGELRGRLRKKGFPAGEVSNCLVWLEERDLLDDHAFSRSLVRDRLNFSPRSPFLLRKELILKGIASTVAEAAVEAVMAEEEASEMELAKKVARSWVRKQGPSALQALLQDRFSEEREGARRRLYRFLVRRGFRGEAAKAGMDAGDDEARKSLG